MREDLAFQIVREDIVTTTTIQAAPPEPWRRPLTYTQARREFAPGTQVRHRNPELADWRGSVETETTGRHGGRWARRTPTVFGAEPVVRVRWIVGGGIGARWFAANALTVDPVETAARKEVLRRVEDLVHKYLNGRIPSNSLRYLFEPLSDLRGKAFEDAFTDAREAYTAWQRAELGEVDVQALEAELADGDVYAEQMRVSLDEALERLVTGR